MKNTSSKFNENSIGPRTVTTPLTLFILPLSWALNAGANSPPPAPGLSSNLSPL